jgi:bifunctional non-homologous end joining protein LigD
MSLRLHPDALPPGFLPPCLPTSTVEVPTGRQWLHEIKHDGFRVIARKNGQRVRLFSPTGNNLTGRFPLIIEAINGLQVDSCIIDGEAVACGPDGVACFELIRRSDAGERVFLWAFDVLELNGQDMRRDTLEARKAALQRILIRAGPGIGFNEHIKGDGASVFQDACKLGLEGIVSKRKDSRYISGRSLHWLTSKNPSAPAVRRKLEEDWSRETIKDERQQSV